LSNYFGELAALGTAVCWAFTAVFFANSGRKASADIVNRSRLLIAFILLSVTHFARFGSWFPWQAESFRWFWLGISSFLGLVIGDTMLFRAFVMLGPRLSTLLMSIVPIVSALSGWLLFGELLLPIEWIGVLLAVGGVAWVVTEKQPGMDIAAHQTYKKGLLYGVGGALGQVANLVTAKYGLVGSFNSLSATLIRIFVAILFLWAWAAFRGHIRTTFQAWRQRSFLLPMLGGSIAGPYLGIWLSLVAISYARLGVASTLMALPPVLLIPVEYFTTRKPVSLRGVTGTLLALFGVALLFLPGG
jgi:drug/metabolite transporter (DMT)-like permease